MGLRARDRQPGRICRYSFGSALMLDNAVRRLFQNPGKILGGLVREGMTAIDIGCGPGMFTLAMARLAGPTGKVIAVDLQQEMLDRLRTKSDRFGLTPRIAFHRNTPDSLGIDTKADFILSFYMVHEVPDQVRFFREVRGLLKPGGKYLIVEPKFHVSWPAFAETVERARRSGLALIESPRITLSRAALFEVSS
ncbi:MAG TPA: class I SAM-dependent methyltransferase [Methanoregula sp.]|nr:class I SAM-dependent methyltransferase [Methanoregula sp.]